MRAFILSTLAVLSLLTSAGAEHCTGPTTQTDAISTCVGVDPCFYYDNDSCEPECVFDVWIYQESNGLAGLQRADGFKDDTCHSIIEADTILF